MICKLRDASYRSGKSQTWLKVKCVQRDTFTIAGFVPGRDAVAALHLARSAASTLVYAGKAGTGFSRKAAHELRRRLDPLRIEAPALKLPMRDKGSLWVRPELEARIDYRAITGDGLLRHAAFKGLAPRSGPTT